MIEPCPRCGYDAPPDGAGSAACPTCSAGTLEPSLREPLATWPGAWAGVLALFQGLRWLATTRGTKRWTIPPAVLSFALFALLYVWLSRLVAGWIEALREGVAAPDASWFVRGVHWLFEHSAFAALADLGGVLLALTLVCFAMLWTFSFVYQLVSGPFLDEIHARVERRWFGVDPREVRERGEGGHCFARRARTELRTLATSVEASALSAVLLAFALPVLLLPLAGWLVFALAAGFTTAIGLLDVALSRRRWGLRLRFAFVLQHFPAVLAFGATSGLVFVVPVLGPLVLVPAASVGALWLVCRLDKRALRAGEGARPGP